MNSKSKMIRVTCEAARRNTSYITSGYRVAITGFNCTSQVAGLMDIISSMAIF